MKLEPITGIDELTLITKVDDLSVGDIITSWPRGGYYDWKIVGLDHGHIYTIHRERGTEEFSTTCKMWDVNSFCRGDTGKYPKVIEYDPSQVGDCDDDI